MKPVLPLMCFLALTPGSLRGQTDRVPQPRCSKARAAIARQLGQAAPPLRLELAEDPTWADTDVIHYNLELNIDPAQRFLSGNNIMTIEPLKNDLTSFRFRLDERLQTSEVSIGGTPLKVKRLDAETLEVTLDHRYVKGEVFNLKVVYSGYPNNGGFGGIYFGTQSGLPVAFTLSEPWYSYTWWPLKDDNRDKATADLIFTVPDSLTVVSNGLLTATETIANNRKRFHWVTKYQTAPYLFCFSASRYNAYTENFPYAAGTMPINYFLFPQSDTPTNRRICGLSPTMLEAFGQRFGLYPFIAEKHCFYQFGWGGGMEHQTAIGIGMYDEILFAHELAHQWWGDLITCATWHDLWLNEGFATWAEAIWAENRPGGSRQAMLNQMAWERPGDVNGTVYIFDTGDENRLFSDNLTYRKAAWVIHMLRSVLGDERFFTFLTAYRERFAFKTVLTEEFQALAEEYSGGPLDWFFDEWVYQPGAPTYRYSWQEAQVGARRYAEIYVKQVQQDSYPTFTMPVDISIAAGGARKTVRVFNNEREEHFLVPIEGSLSQVSFDPEGLILSGSTLATGFVEGPPKVIAVSPAPGSDFHAILQAPITVTFHKDVQLLPSSFTLIGAGSGSVPVNLTYDRQTFTATITPQVPLYRNTYTLTISDEIQDVASSQRLDGEVIATATSSGFPSGDGVPGGSAIITYTTSGIVRRRLGRGGS